MVPALTKGGRSFKGAALYYLHDKRQDSEAERLTTDRVAWTETVNLATEDPERAWRVMADTALSQAHLKAAAGVKATGRKLAHPVHAYSLAWHPSERPTRTEMMEAVRESLAAQGLDEHQALIVRHSDTAHPHVHVIVNRIHPVTGKAARLSHAKLKLSRWAQAYEQRRGQTFCRRRRLHNAMRGQGIHVRARRPARPRRGKAFWQGLYRPFDRAANDHARTAPASFPVAAALDALTRDRSTFTRRDMARLVSRHTTTADAFRAAMAALEASPELVRLSPDKHGPGEQGAERFTTRAMHAIERRMERHAVALHSRRGHAVPPPPATRLSAEQLAARDHVLTGGDIAAVIGYAGSGKSTMLGEARAAWEAAGFRVQGMALSGIAAEGLEHGAGIDSATIHSRLYQWDRGKNRLTARDVLVIDEAGMIGSRMMERILAHARRAGAKVVLVGDPAQLQAIEAGGAFRSIIRRTGAAVIATVRRQHAAWQQDATRELATGQAAAALARYDAHGMLHGHADMDAARAALIRQWDDARRAAPGESQIILAFRRDDVRDLNERARAQRRAAGELGADYVLPSESGPLAVASGDRLVFLKNDRALGVRNGTLATVIAISHAAVTVRLDDGRAVTFSPAAYPHLAHGYAVTVHKSQGMTVDRAFLLASRNLDRHAAYVGMSRHRASVHVHWSRDEFSDRDWLAACFARDGFKDTSLDYAPDIAAAWSASAGFSTTSCARRAAAPGPSL